MRSIARRYKTQCQEMTKQMEEMKNKPAEEPTPPVEPVPVVPLEIPAQEQDRLRQEGRQQVEAEMNDRFKELGDQVNHSKNNFKII